MARLADLLTRASGGRLLFDRFTGGLIIADAIFAQLEAAATEDGALYIEDELVIDGNNLDLARYTHILPPFDHWWIEAKSAKHKGAWVGVVCAAYTAEQARMRSQTRRDLEKMLQGSGVPIGSAIDYGWLLNLYPISVLERGGGRLTVIAPHSMQQVFLDPDGNLMTRTPMIRQAPELHRNVITALGLPDLPADVAVNCAPLVLEVLALLGCVNVQQTTIAPDPALKKAREKQYGVPMSSYKVLTFKGRDISTLPSAPTGGTHASPREHMVRRHFKWRGGQRFLWSPHLRGNPARGRVAKTYDVRPTEDSDGSRP